MIPQPFYIIFLIFIGISLLVFAYGLFTVTAKKKPPIKKTPIQGTINEGGVCPICCTRLVDGAQIKSALFPGEKDRICHIFGCPHCHPYKQESINRKCPVCKKPLSQEGYLIARLFDRPNKKRHVHILGCTGCRLPQKH